MNIGLVTTWFDRGAAYVSRAYRDTLQAKHDVFIYARGGERYATGETAWDHEYVTWGKPVPNKIVTHVDWDDFHAWVKRRRLDLVIFNEQISWEIILHARSLGIPLGAYVDYYTRTTVPFFRAYDFLFCNTRRHHGVFRDHPQAFFLPWGTDCEMYRPRNRPTRADVLTFFHSAGMGGTNTRKGTDLLVRAFGAVTGSARLVIHSQIPLAEYPGLNAIVRGHERIDFIEETVGPPGLYHLGDVYVYPTRLEGIGLTVPEALASGLPVITTDSPPMSEFVIPGVNGQLVDVAAIRTRGDGYYWPETTCSEADLVAKMQYYVDRRADLPELSRAARRHAETHLDWKTNSAPLPDLMCEIHGLPVPERLLRSIARYERSQYPAKGIARLVRGAARRIRAVTSAIQRN